MSDRRLAPAAVALATVVTAGKQRGPLRWATSVIFIIWLTVPAAVGWIRHQWLIAAALSLGPVFFVALLGAGIVLGRKAGEALELNRRLAGN